MVDDKPIVDKKNARTALIFLGSVLLIGVGLGILIVAAFS